MLRAAVLLGTHVSSPAQTDEEIESHFKYELTPELQKEFANSTDLYFDVKKEYRDCVSHINTVDGDKKKALVHRVYSRLV